MSLDRSLKSANALIRHRNVLTRAERLDKLTEDEKWNESKSPLGLPKVGHRKQTLAKAVKEDRRPTKAPQHRAPRPPLEPPLRGCRRAPRALARPLERQGLLHRPLATGAAPAAKAAAPAKKK